MKDRLFQLCCIMLILLFSYTGVSKLADMTTFHRELFNQPYGKYWAPIVQWLLPFLELFAALLITFDKTRFVGFWLAFAMMVVFTLYVGLILFGIVPRRPCSCAGVFKIMGWKMHFIFNLLFTAIAFAALKLQKNNETYSHTSFFNQNRIT